MPSTTCDRCTEPSTWQAYAAYDIPNDISGHPIVARYPAPMIHACAAHLGEALSLQRIKDGSSPLATRTWVVEPA